MAKRRLTDSQKAQNIAKTARYLAETLATAEYDGRAATPELSRRIDRAYRALRYVSASYTRSIICQFLAVAGETKDPVARVRSYLTALANGAEMDIDADVDAVTDAAIRTAVTAWQRRGGRPKRDEARAENKWSATLRLFRAYGIAENVTAEALRKEHNRWLAVVKNTDNRAFD